MPWTKPRDMGCGPGQQQTGQLQQQDCRSKLLREFNANEPGGHGDVRKQAASAKERVKDTGMQALRLKCRFQTRQTRPRRLLARLPDAAWYTWPCWTKGKLQKLKRLGSSEFRV